MSAQHSKVQMAASIGRSAILALGLPVTLALLVPGTTLAGLETWSVIGDPVEGTDSYQRLVAGNTHVFACVIDSSQIPLGLFKREHDSQSQEWEDLGVAGHPWGLSVAGAQDNHVLVSTLEEKVWYSSDGGSSWVDRTAGLPPSGFVDRVLVHESGYAYATVRQADPGFLHGVARSTNFGVSWNFSEWCEGDCFFNGFFDIIADDSTPGKAWASFMDGFFEMQLMSAESGLDWQELDLPGPVSWVTMGLAQDRLLTDRVFWMMPNRIWWFDGSDFTDAASLPLPGGANNMAIATPPWDPGVLYAAGKSSSGVKVFTSSEDPYTGWTSVSEGLPPTEVPSPANQVFKYGLSAVPNQAKLYLAVWGLGLYERDFVMDPAGVDDATQDIRMPVISSLFPNPTKGHVDWTLELSEPAELELSIVDVSGKTIFRSEPKMMQTGLNDLGSLLRADFGEFPSGVYFFSLRHRSQVLWSQRVSIVR